jgi:outer membrane protein TolC
MPGIPSAQNVQIPVIENMIEIALNNNPEILALKKNVEASKTRISRSGTLPDPVLKLGLMNLPVNSFAFDQEPMTGKQVMIMQTFPFFGTLKLKKNVFQYMNEVAGIRVHAKQNEIIRKVKEALFNLTYLKSAILLSEENQTVLDQFALIAKRKYEVGKGLQQDVLRAQVSQSKNREMIIMLQNKKRSTEALLNTLLDWSVDNTVEQIPKFNSSPFKWTRDSLIRLAEKHNPALRIKQIVIDIETSRKRLAKRSYLPKFDLSASYTQREDIMDMTMHDFFSAQIGFKLPLWFWRNQVKQVQEAGHKIKQSRKELESVKNNLEFQITDLEIQMNEKDELLKLYDTGILPLWEQNIQSALSSYQVNKVDFLTLLNTQKAQFMDALSYERILADREIILARLEETVGKRLF